MKADLRIELDGKDVATFTLEDRPLVLGRGTDVDVFVADQRLSRRHCQVEISGRNVIVTDLGSSNGTYIKGKRIERGGIGSGESFYIGRSRVTLEALVTDSQEAQTIKMSRAEVLGAAEARKPTESSEKLRRQETMPFGVRREAITGKAAPQPVLPPPPGERRPGAPERPASPASAQPAPGARSESPARTDSGRLRASPVEGYEILSHLAQGSMGTVFRAKRLETGELCVLKTIKFSGSPKDAIFFIRECQAGTKIRHPNVVQMIDFGESAGCLYLAMEYVEGGNLLDRIKQGGPLPDREALFQLRHVTEALIYASRKNIVHRDIKPANILLTRDGVPKLADFGLAKTMAGGGKGGMTQAGETRGTPIYMPPEMLMSAADADERADIYSLGATYYHAISGRHPFRASTVPQILRMVVQVEPKPLEEHNPAVHPELAKMIRRMMRKNASERFQTPTELAADIERVSRLVG